MYAGDKPYVKEYSTDISAAWEIVKKLVEEGFCPALIYDDEGHWALATEGTQNLPDEGQPLYTSFLVPSEYLCDTESMAICRDTLLLLFEEEE
jgi:hypothetical protein